MRILFVDDEPQILTGIENALGELDPAADPWQADFATDGAEALALMATTDYDVLVTDMKMPGIDGADVLERAKLDHPRVIRLVLSDEIDPSVADRALPLAHDLVAKPCDPGHLFDVITRVHDASRCLMEGPLGRAVGSLERLPAQPALHIKVQQALQNGEGADAVALLIEGDLAIASTIVKTANSAFYGFRAPAETVRDAVVRLGIQTVAGLVLNAEILQWAAPELRSRVARINSRSALVAEIVRRLIGRGIGQASLAALLHDIGLLVLVTQLPDEYRALQKTCGRGGKPSEEMEREWFGTTHAELGACLLELWRVDRLVVDATRAHHHKDLGSLDRDVRLVVEAIAAAELAQEPDGDCPDDLDPDLAKRARLLVSDIRNAELST